MLGGGGGVGRLREGGGGGLVCSQSEPAYRIYNLKQNEALSVRAESPHKGVN